MSSALVRVTAIFAYTAFILLGYFCILNEATAGLLLSSTMVMAESPAGSTMIAGFGGAVVGGGISYLVSWQANRETLRRDLEARFANEHATAIRIIMSAVELTNHAYTIQMMLSEAIQRKPANSDDLFAYVTPFITPNRPLPSFVSDDLAFLVISRRSELIQDCAQLSDQVATLNAAFLTYNEHRTSWDTFASQHSIQRSDGSWSSEFKGKDASIAQFRAYQMNDILSTIITNAPRHVADGNKLIDALQKHYIAYFGQRAVLGVKNTSASTAAE